jgi:hypothetical protein
MVSPIHLGKSIQTLSPSSYHKTGEEAQFQAARYCNSHCLFSTLLHQEFVLRDGPVYCHRSMLLRGGESGGVTGTH